MLKALAIAVGSCALLGFDCARAEPATAEAPFRVAGTPGEPAPDPKSAERLQFADRLIAAWKLERARCADYLQHQQPTCPAGVPPVADSSSLGNGKVSWECSYDCAAQGDERYRLRIVEVTPAPTIPALTDADGWWDAALADWRSYEVIYKEELQRVCRRTLGADPAQLEDARVQASPALQDALRRLDDNVCSGCSYFVDIKDWTPRFTRERGPLSGAPLPYLCSLKCDCGKVHTLRQQFEAAFEKPVEQIVGPSLLASSCTAVLPMLARPDPKSLPRLRDMPPTLLARRALRKATRREVDADRIGASVACRHARGEARVAELVASPSGCTRDGAQVTWRTVLVPAPHEATGPVSYDGAIGCTATCRCPAGTSGARCRLEGIAPSSLLSEAEETQLAADEKRRADDAERQQRLAACLPGELPKARDACEERCGVKVKVTRCVFGQRKCLAKAHKGSETDRSLCATGYRQCLVESGVEVEAFELCVAKCQQDKAQSACSQ